MYSYNIGKMPALLDIYTQCLGQVRIYQAKQECLCYNQYVTLSALQKSAQA